MSSVALELIVIALLLVLNGVFAMSELAIVSSRKALLQKRASEGDARSAQALALASNPGDFLATVQVGITLIGVIAGAFGGATLAEELGAYIARVPAFAGHGESLALALVVALITYLSLIVGELVPKRLALHHPEQIAIRVAGPLRMLALAARPLVRLIGGSSDAVLWLLGVPKNPEHKVTEDEIRFLIDQGARTGTIESLEHEMVDSVLSLGDRRVTALMTPRTEMLSLDVGDSIESVRAVVSNADGSDLPVIDGSMDNVLGVVRIRDIFARALSGEPFDLRPLVRHALFVPNTASTFTTLQKLREAQQSMAFIVDEFGGLEGVMTLDRVMEAVLGDAPLTGGENPEAVRRPDGSWLVDGTIPLERLKEALDVSSLPDEGSGSFHTAAGFALAQFGHIPKAGSAFGSGGWRFEVVDMDGRRIDKILITPEVQEGGPKSDEPE
ncbi:MAG: HlyC/CorC family transporter [Candidatus Hydrogenedentes bacterium]|nr:HlyC/CorC family transporter [Candidatus Hydrogenedentota bacterium]